MKTKSNSRPIHMTPFEGYMFVDDRPKYPMTFVVEFELQGCVDRNKLQSAVNQALVRHPLLRSLIQTAKANRDCWILVEDATCPIEFGKLDDQIQVDGASEFIDLRTEIGLRVWCRHDDERAILTTVFHHSACDGIGAYQFLGDVFWYYAEEFGGDNGELQELEPSQLRKRLRTTIPKGLVAYDETQLEPNDFQPLQLPRNKSELNGMSNPYPKFHSHVFEKDEFRQLRLQAQELGQTVNDRLLESLFEALSSWNAKHNPAGDDRDLCVYMPLDLREAGQPDFSAANLVTCAFVHRSAEEIADSTQLSKSLREELVHLKHTRHDSEFMTELFNLPVDFEMASNSIPEAGCLATAVFSNAGDPTRRFLVDLPRKKGVVQIGNLQLIDLWGASPIRELTRVAVNIFTYRRRLKICMRFDPLCFSQEDGKAFLDHFVECFAGEPVCSS